MCTYIHKHKHTHAHTTYRVGQSHRMPYLTGHFPKMSPFVLISLSENDLSLLSKIRHPMIAPHNVGLSIIYKCIYIHLSMIYVYIYTHTHTHKHTHVHATFAPVYVCIQMFIPYVSSDASLSVYLHI